MVGKFRGKIIFEEGGGLILFYIFFKKEREREERPGHGLRSAMIAFTDSQAYHSSLLHTTTANARGDKLPKA